MGTKQGRQKQEELFYASERTETAGHPFYEQLNSVLNNAGFDAFCEERCGGFYHSKLGRPSLAPGVYFRLLLIGFFEGIASERGIGWRVADSFSLRRFLNYGFREATPDHVTISRTRRLLDEATHQAVFTFVLTEVARRGMLKGKTIGIDATTLEANAAMRSIVRRDTGESYMEYLRRLATEAGLDGADDTVVRRMDRKRKKKTSNEEWMNPHDREAEVTKMKNGATHLAYKAEQAVDLDTGAIVAITTQGGAVGDTTSVQETCRLSGGRADRHAHREGPVQSSRTRAVRSRDRQGLSQRRGFGRDARDGRADLRFGSATATAQVGRQSRATSRGVRQQAARGRQAGQGFVAAAR